METALFEIQFNDGRIFRVFCANSTQVRKTLLDYDKLKKEGKVNLLKTISNGIHTTAQWHKILENENKN
jgi:hypothetical protein